MWSVVDAREVLAWIGTGSGRLGREEKAGVGERKPTCVLAKGDRGSGLEKHGVGEKEGDPLAERVIEELNDWSTSMGNSDSVLVGDVTGDEKRVEGKESRSGDEENMSMVMVFEGTESSG